MGHLGGEHTFDLQTFVNQFSIPSSPTPTTTSISDIFGGRTVIGTTGQTVTTSEQLSRLTQSAETSTQNILASLQQRIANLGQLSFGTQSLVTENLLGLGQASLDISSALNENITIRENQRAIDQERANNLQIQLNSANERLSTQVQELGRALQNIGQGSFDPISFLTENPLIGGIGIGGLAVGAVVLLLVLR